MVKEICHLDCVHKEECNKRFNEMLTNTKEGVVNIAAKCGIFILGIKHNLITGETKNESEIIN